MQNTDVSKNNGFVVFLTVILSILVGMLITLIFHEPVHKNIWINVPAGESRKFDVQETDTSINITLK